MRDSRFTELCASRTPLNVLACTFFSRTLMEGRQERQDEKQGKTKNYAQEHMAHAVYLPRGRAAFFLFMIVDIKCHDHGYIDI